VKRTGGILTMVVITAVGLGCGARIQPLPAASPTSPATPGATVVLVELSDGQAWSAVKAAVGPGVLVLRPTWVPGRFQTDPVILEYAYVAGPDVRYRVGYRAADGLINIAAGAANSAVPTVVNVIALRGANAEYSTTSSWPERQITWTEAGVLYSIQARGVSEAEIMQIANGLVAVP
jgi:hypothetical protein